MPIMVYITFDQKRYSYKLIQPKLCKNLVLLFPKTRPSFWRWPKLHLAEYPEAGLVFRTTNLRFISCHMATNAWINQLKELVSAFDVSTWFSLIISPVIVSITVSYALCGCIRHFKEVFEICYGFVSALLD